MGVNKYDSRPRWIRHRRVRKKAHGTSERPRLAVFRSNKQIYAQIINDDEGRTLAAHSSRELSAGAENKSSAAAVVGAELAKKALAAGVKHVVFDRGGYMYHGRVKALADAARSEGLEF